MFKNVGKIEEYKEYTQYNDKMWRIEWDLQPITITLYDSEGNPTNETVGDNENASWEQHNFTTKPEINEIKSMIVSYFDAKTKNAIINGFVWENENGVLVNPKLTQENQFNYKAAYDFAVQTNGNSLPFTVKYGDVSEPSYYEFSTLEEFSDFYTSCLQHINECIINGWRQKDSIDWSKYSEINDDDSNTINDID